MPYANISLKHFTKQGISLMYTENNDGPGPEPCGTPTVITKSSDVQLFAFTTSVLSDKNDDIMETKSGDHRQAINLQFLKQQRIVEYIKRIWKINKENGCKLILVYI